MQVKCKLFLAWVLAISLVFFQGQTAGYAAEDYRFALALALDKLQDLDHYALDYKLVNEETGQVIFLGQVVVNEESGDLHFKSQSYEDLGGEDPGQEPERFDFYSFDNLSLAYISQGPWLDSVDFFDQEVFHGAQLAKYPELVNARVAISPNYLENISWPSDLLAILALFPNGDRLDQVDPAHLTYSQGWYQLDLERVEIPPGLFSYLPGINLRFNLESQISQRPGEDWRVQLTDWLSYNENISGFYFSRRVQQEVDWRSLNFTPGSEVDRQSFLFDERWALDSRDITDKLTQLILTFNPQEKDYRLSLTGIAEFFELNFFQYNAAKLTSASYRLDIHLVESQEPLPSFRDMEALSQAEYAYLMECLLRDREDYFHLGPTRLQ